MSMTEHETRPAPWLDERWTLPISYARSFLQGLPVDALTQRSLLHQSAISPALFEQQAGRMTQEQFARLFRGVAQHLDDEMPGLYARPLRCGTLKVLSILLLDAPTLEVALKRWVQFNHVLDDGAAFIVECGKDQVCVRIDARPCGGRSARLAQELHLKLVHGLCSWLIGSRIALTHVDFSFAKPDDAAEYLMIYPGPVRYGQAVTAMCFDLKYLRQPVRARSKIELRDFLQRAPLDWLFVPVGQASAVRRVRDWLQAHLNQDMGIVDVAAGLGQSARTLVRHLQSEGAQFQSIKDNLRRDAAVARLARGKEPVFSIAADLGFSSVASFHRAFRKWTGGTPGDYRGGESADPPSRAGDEALARFDAPSGLASPQSPAFTTHPTLRPASTISSQV